MAGKLKKKPASEAQQNTIQGEAVVIRANPEAVAAAKELSQMEKDLATLDKRIASKTEDIERGDHQIEQIEKAINEGGIHKLTARSNILEIQGSLRTLRSELRKLEHERANLNVDIAKRKGTVTKITGKKA
ncbi:MAG: hypothetical protein GY852_03450 [bacterium]|nr:hypothetical protein [bacterium]